MGMDILKIVIGLLFLVVATSGLAIGDCDRDAATYPDIGGNWIRKADAPTAGGFGEAVVSTANNIYIAHCHKSSSDPKFWRYDPWTEDWDLMSTSGLSTGAFRNGAAMAWDYDDHIYALFGGTYNDSNRTLFYRYNISCDDWERLADTPNGQGAGDAITWSEYDGCAYAMIGSNARETVFARYSHDSWETLAFNPNWTFTDDGASLVWAGGEYLYALRGEYNELVPNGDFARYHIPTDAWEDMTDIPEGDGNGNGVGDGASLLWIGNWLDGYSDCIFALGGGNADGEAPGYGFYRYSISCNGWDELEPLPCPVGFYVGNRLGFVDGQIHYWQGAPKSERWICGGDAFCMFQPTSKGDTNGDGWITTADAVIALNLAVRGGYDLAADMNDDGSVTSLDALMIMQAAGGRIDP